MGKTLRKKRTPHRRLKPVFLGLSLFILFHGAPAYTEDRAADILLLRESISHLFGGRLIRPPAGRLLLDTRRQPDLSQTAHVS